MRSKTILTLLTALLFNIFAALAVAAYFQIEPLPVVIAFLGVAIVLGSVKPVDSKRSNMAFNAILKEISLPEIMTKFYSDTSWLGRARNLDPYVVADTINIAEAGISPEVLLNNTTYPITIAEREDGNKSFVLDTLDTENTRCGSLEQMLASYDRRQSIIADHKASLLDFSGKKAAHAYAPASNTADTPVIATTGGAVDIEGSNFKAIKFADILTMHGKFKTKKFTSQGGVIICLLSPIHQAQLLAEDMEKYKALMDLSVGKATHLFGIDFYEYADTAVFNRSNLTKKTFGAAEAGTDSPAVSQFFVDKEVFRCDGTYNMFMRENDPEYRGDIVGFQKRFLAASMRNKAIGSIVTVSS